MCADVAGRVRHLKPVGAVRFAGAHLCIGDFGGGGSRRQETRTKSWVALDIISPLFCSLRLRSKSSQSFLILSTSAMGIAMQRLYATRT